MATNTYVALDKVTVGTATNSITFSSIPSTYTDLVLVATGKNSTSFDGIDIRVGNGSLDTGSNYSQTMLNGNGSSAQSSRDSNATSMTNMGITSSSTEQVSIYHFMNYSNTTTYKTVLARSNVADFRVAAIVGLWRSTSAINTIQLRSDNASYNFTVGSTFSLYGIAAVGASPAAKATGGAIYSDDLYYYHVFGSTGTFTPLSSLSCDYVIVAGGGGSGGANYAGGGGAGGLRQFTSQTLSATGYTVTIGGGGSGGAVNNIGTSGSNSSFNSASATGGGRGGGDTGSSTRQGASGGSGGGNYLNFTSAGGAGNAGSYSPVEGYAGGASVAGSPYQGGTGGGGAGGTGNYNAYGGIGATSSLINAIGAATGVAQLSSGNYYLAGGGAGGAGTDFTLGQTTAVPGGAGGGGNGGGYTAGGTGSNGVANTGGGAGGVGGYGSTGYAGGSGVVIVRYLKA
jgi:hypothetical protein